MFNKLLLILILVFLYHNLSFNDKQNVKDLASDTIYNLGTFAQELKREGNHSTMATDETYCPTPENAPNYPRQIIYYDTQDNQFVE